MPAAEGGYGYIIVLGPSVFIGVNHQFLQKWCYILLVSSSGHGSYRFSPSCNKALPLRHQNVGNMISAGQERIGQKKNEKDRHVSIEVEAASRKKRKWCTMRCSRQKSRSVDRVALHISTRAWIVAQKPGSTVKISFPLLDFYSSTSLSRLRSTTQLATHGAAPKSIGRKVEKPCPIGASKHGRSG